MLSVNYSLNCVTFDPKGKILQVSQAHENNVVEKAKFACILIIILVD